MILFCAVSLSSMVQRFSITPYLGIGDFTPGNNSNGKLSLGAYLLYSLNSKFDIGIEGSLGGNFIPGDGEISNDQTELILNPKSFSFDQLGGNLQYNKSLFDNRLDVYALLSSGVVRHSNQNMGLANNESISQSNFYYGVEIGGIVQNVRVGFRYHDLGHIDAFNGRTEDGRLASMEGTKLKILLLTFGYRLKLGHK